MARVKRGVTSHAKHKKVLKAAKGYYGRRKNTIRVARQAVENDVHIVGVSSLAAGHLTLVPALRQALEEQRHCRNSRGEKSCAELMGEFGSVFRGPRDLSTNPKHMRDFGK